MTGNSVPGFGKTPLAPMDDPDTQRRGLPGWASVAERSSPRRRMWAVKP